MTARPMESIHFLGEGRGLVGRDPRLKLDPNPTLSLYADFSSWGAQLSDLFKINFPAKGAPEHYMTDFEVCAGASYCFHIISDIWDTGRSETLYCNA